ncbi:hypothetical protein HUU42_13680 [bacterium]|nr:hypothetical protein [bacterium]
MKKLLKEIRWYAGFAILALMIVPSKHTSEIARRPTFYPARMVLSSLEKLESGIQLHTGLDEKEKSEVETIASKLRVTQPSYPILATAYRTNAERSLPE